MVCSTWVPEGLSDWSLLKGSNDTTLGWESNRKKYVFPEADTKTLNKKRYMVCPTGVPEVLSDWSLFKGSNDTSLGWECNRKKIRPRGSVSFIFICYLIYFSILYTYEAHFVAGRAIYLCLTRLVSTWPKSIMWPLSLLNEVHFISECLPPKAPWQRPLWVCMILLQKSVLSTYEGR